ncbi:hypothetical protein LCGC14_1003430 [marine sediment metagenome]|uniref:Uncharacterized protein n=1 Tax=marine sediment metagenome TaxID=412755 RepID=A0A0F9R8F3_9ZZZZ
MLREKKEDRRVGYKLKKMLKVFDNFRISHPPKLNPFAIR